jgi:hypothetical protein
MPDHDYFPRSSPVSIAGTLFLAIALGACSRSSPPAQSTQVKPATLPAAAAVPAPAVPMAPRAWKDAPKAALMRALFGDRYRQASKDALAVVESEGAEGHYLMTYVAGAELPDGRIAVIVNGSLSNESGSDLTSHGQPGMLNVYLLQRQGKDWNVLERHENVSTLGSYGHVGGVDWIGLGPGKPGFIVHSGDTGQGYSIGFADIFELGNGVRALGSFKQDSDNGGACGPETDECWDIDSTLRVAGDGLHGGYPDLLAEFKGKRYTVTEAADKEVEHVKTVIRQTARYRFDGKAYRLVEGTNPVPDV